MHVQAHAVSQSVRHEEGHGAGSDGIFRRAAHQAQRDEAFGQDAVRGVVDIHVRHVRGDHGGHPVVRRQHDVVNVFLFLGELAAYGVSTGVVGTVVAQSLGSGVAQQQAAVLQYAVAVQVMQRFAVLRHDRRERHAPSECFGNAFDRAGDFALDDAGTAHLHCRSVHGVADVERFFELLDLLGTFLFPHLGYGHHQLDRLVIVQCGRFEAQQVGEQQLGFASVRGQVVDAASLDDGFGQVRFQVGQREGVRNACFGPLFAQRRLRPRPDDVFDREVVAVQRNLSGVGIDQADQRRGVESEVVEERGVLAEIIGVVEVVVGCEHIARNEDQAAAHLAAQGAAASDVDFFCKHSRIFL